LLCFGLFSVADCAVFQAFIRELPIALAGTFSQA
jgi:hypothetical protein